MWSPTYKGAHDSLQCLCSLKPYFNNGFTIYTLTRRRRQLTGFSFIAIYKYRDHKMGLNS